MVGFHQGYKEGEIVTKCYLNVCYEGTDNATMIQGTKDSTDGETFHAQYMHESGFDLDGRDILVDDHYVRPGETPALPVPVEPLGALTPAVVAQHRESSLRKIQFQSHCFILCRSAIYVNMKEHLDFSCALFNHRRL